MMRHEAAVKGALQDALEKASNTHSIVTVY